MPYTAFTACTHHTKLVSVPHLRAVVDDRVETQNRHVIAQVVVGQHADGVDADNLPVLVFLVLGGRPPFQIVQQRLFVVPAGLVDVALAERDVPETKS
jgi:hypothetical protein